MRFYLKIKNVRNFFYVCAVIYKTVFEILSLKYTQVATWTFRVT